MTSKNLTSKSESQDSEFDMFEGDIERDGTTEAQAPQPPADQPGRLEILSKVKPEYAFLAVALVGGTCYAFWPQAQSNSRTEWNMAFDNPTPLPQQAQTQHHLINPTLLTSAENNAESSGADSPSGSDVRDLATEIAGRIETLQKRVLALESRPFTALSTDSANAMAALTAPSTPIVQKTASKRFSQSKVNSGPKLKDYRLNTVYSDQAWLGHGDYTYVVQVGDEINGLKIVSIDPESRTVGTSQGLIK